MCGCNSLCALGKLVGAERCNFAFALEGETLASVFGRQRWLAVLLGQVKLNIADLHIIFAVFDDRKLESACYLVFKRWQLETIN